MIKVRIISVGKIKEHYLSEGEREYQKRLKPFASLEFIETGVVKGGGAVLPDQVKREEGRMVLSKLREGEFFIALDEKGALFTSSDFSEELQRLMNSGVSSFTFGIGGPYGWDDGVRKRANLLWSLSPLTFPYQLVRLILVEQLYRAATLWNKIPYHK